MNRNARVFIHGPGRLFSDLHLDITEYVHDPDIRLTMAASRLMRDSSFVRASSSRCDDRTQSAFSLNQPEWEYCGKIWRNCEQSDSVAVEIVIVEKWLLWCTLRRLFHRSRSRSDNPLIDRWESPASVKPEVGTIRARFRDLLGCPTEFGDFCTFTPHHSGEPKKAKRWLWFYREPDAVISNLCVLFPSHFSTPQRQEGNARSISDLPPTQSSLPTRHDHGTICR
jgi:hypothetical protein